MRRRECSNCQHRYNTYETTQVPGANKGMTETQKAILQRILTNLTTLCQQLLK